MDEESGPLTTPLVEQTAAQWGESAKSIRRLRAWIVVLALGLVLSLLGGCVPLALFAVSSFGDTPSPGELASVRSQVSEALGDRLASLDVTTVTISHGTPFPLSLLDDTHAIQVRASLRGSGVVVSDLVDTPSDLPNSGLLPTKASLDERLTDAQYDALLTSFRSETSSSLGPVFTYASVHTEVSGDTAAIGGKTYRTSELWVAFVGLVVRDGTIPDADFELDNRRALVFRWDPKTRRFIHLGSETDPSPSPLPSGD